jgi:hypothetical protein
MALRGMVFRNSLEDPPVGMERDRDGQPLANYECVALPAELPRHTGVSK